MEHLIEKHGKLFRTLEDVSEMPIGGLESDGISDFDAEHIALIMFQYFGPLLCNFDLTRADPTFQYLMGIRDYVAAHLGEVKYDQKVNPLAQQVLELEGRVRVEELENT